MTSARITNPANASNTIEQLRAVRERHGVGRAERHRIGRREVQVVDVAGHPVGDLRRAPAHLVDRVVVLVLREPEVGELDLLARLKAPRDRPAAIHLPVDQGEGDDVRHPDLNGGEQQLGPVGALRHEQVDQLHERELVGDEQDERGRRPPVAATRPSHVKSVRIQDEQRDEHHCAQPDDHVAQPGREARRQQRVEHERDQDGDGGRPAMLGLFPDHLRVPLLPWPEPRCPYGFVPVAADVAISPDEVSMFTSA